MTINEADIARLAFQLGQRCLREGSKSLSLDILNAFILRYKPEHPCGYATKCLLDGVCPFKPTCND